MLYGERIVLYQLEEWQRARAVRVDDALLNSLYQLEEWQRARARRDDREG